MMAPEKRQATTALDWRVVAAASATEPGRDDTLGEDITKGRMRGGNDGLLTTVRRTEQVEKIARRLVAKSALTSVRWASQLVGKRDSGRRSWIPTVRRRQGRGT
jgi:hypothetical protein